MNLVQGKKVGSPTTKSVLMYMADRASDGGIGIWVSKPNIAAHLEMGISTVKKQVNILCDKGILIEAGKRKCRHGFTINYSISLEALRELPDVKATPDTVSPRHDVTPYPVTTEPPTPSRRDPKPSLEPSIEPSLPPKVPQGDFYSKIEKAEYFEMFWLDYPNKVGKAAAKNAFEKALDRIDFVALMNGLQRYINKTDDRPWCNPSTWLNQDRWEDQPAQQPQKLNKREIAIQRMLNGELDDDDFSLDSDQIKTIEGFTE